MLLLSLLFYPVLMSAQTVAPPAFDLRMYDIIQEVSADRLENDVRTLANFGTRNTFSDTVSTSRGIGAARRWIKAQFDQISADCDGCLEVFYQKDLVTKEGNRRVPHDAWVVNVVAVQKGTTHPNRHVIIIRFGISKPR